MSLAQDLKKIVKGEVRDDAATLDRFSRDASLLTVRPEVVVAPKDVADIQALIRFVGEEKKHQKNISLTPRSAGTDMSGGPLSESIILDMTAHFQGVLGVNKVHNEATVLPGTFYRDFEKATKERGLILPCYTASKELNTVGGMVGNNSAGEKTLRYGSTKKWVRKLKVIFSDGNEYEVKPMTKAELELKIKENTLEGRLYRDLYLLLTTNYPLVQSARPDVSKNSAGYYLWDVWDGDTFDLTQLIVGSQGTLGIVTEITFELVPVKPVSKLLVIFLQELGLMAQVVNTLLPFHPESLEAYDDNTQKLELKFFPDLVKAMKQGLISLAWSFLPEFGMIVRGGFPKMVLLAEVAGETLEEVDAKLLEMQKAMSTFRVRTRITRDENDTRKYWTIRRESFNILRKHVHGRRTAPFIDDIVVRPDVLPEFLPKLQALIKEYGIFVTIQGHIGNGNFHIIPLMDMSLEENRKIIPELSEKVYDLVLSYKGSITAEHNDGLIRTPYLERQFGREVCELFKKTKEIFDPLYIFNPGKKVPFQGASEKAEFSYTYKHLAHSN